MLYLLHHIIENAAQQTPDQVAVRCAGQSLTYARLVQRAERLAWCLREQGIRPGDRVGICLPKSVESAVALYGIMMAGAVYVPLDTYAPLERLRYVILDCGIRGLVSAENMRNMLAQLVACGSPLEFLIGVAPFEGLLLPCIPWEQIDAAPSPALPPARITEQDLAYILYTSGSTGAPKGIMHTHRSGLSFPLWAAEAYGLAGDDRVSSHAPLHFDLSTFDFFATALAGGTVVMIPEALAKFPASVANLIEQEKLSIWYSVPFALVQLLLKGGIHTRDLSSLRWVLFAGEPFPTKHLRDLMAQLPHAGFSNLYGPTETNVCTYYHVPPLDPASDEPIPIGRACANIDDIVVDHNDTEVMAGEIGELLIRGPVVMEGYWGRADLTERGFYRTQSTSSGPYATAEMPFGGRAYYRTGDLVQMLPDGNYKYLGRKDRQVKTRGYRVELDEIEIALLAHPWVQEAAAYTVEDGQGSHLIKAAVTASEDAELTTDLLFRHVAQTLPPYAVPVDIIIVAEFPRTSTGKIDRRSLQAQAVV